MASMAEQVDCVVVGAGWNGLIGAKTYLDFRPDANLVILDEQSSIGGVWCKEKIYPSLFAQMKIGLFEYSFYPMRHEGITENGYISGATIHHYLNDFAWDHDLVRRTRLQTKVTDVARLPGSGGGWRLSIEGRAPIECAKLIYASGATSHAVVPAWPRAGFTSPVIHSVDTGAHLDALRGARCATVVGGAKSAYDTVYLLLQAGAKVHWVIRPDGSGPLALMPPTLLGGLFNTGDVVTTRAMAMMGASVMDTDGFGHQFFQRTALGRFAARSFWRVADYLAARHAGYARSENMEKLRPEPHGNGVFWANAGLGAASVPHFWKVLHDGDLKVHRSEVELLSDADQVTLRDGSRFQTDYVVLCTGFDKSYHVFGDALQHELGLARSPAADEQRRWRDLERAAASSVDELLPELRDSPFGLRSFDQPHEAGGRKVLHGPSLHYRRLVAPALAAQGDRSVYFPGFVHSLYNPVVAEVQALWGVAFLLGLHPGAAPSRGDMDREVAEWNVWSRKRYVAQGNKHAYAIFDFLPYIDQMLKDLGINPRREKNWFKDMFMPAQPSLYNGIVDEFKRVVGEPEHAPSPSSASFSKVGTTSGVATPESGSEAAEPLTPTGVEEVGGYSSGLSLDGDGTLSKKLGLASGRED